MEKYTVKQIATMLQTNPETVRRWIRAGKLKSHQESDRGENIIDKADLESFLNSTPKYSSMVQKGVSSVKKDSAILGDLIIKLINKEFLEVKSNPMNEKLEEVKREFEEKLEELRREFEERKRESEELKRKLEESKRESEELKRKLEESKREME